MAREISIRVDPKTASSEFLITRYITGKYGIPGEEIESIKIVSRSIDARQKAIMVNLKILVYNIGETSATYNRDTNIQILPDNAPSVIIVGAGPAGLFAALKCIRLGLKPIILERGQDVDNRRIDLAAISKTGIVDSESNYCFGEGGAGAYSDGKLFTRSKKRGDVREVLKTLYDFGASSDILIDAHPHIGSDRLPLIIKNIRNAILKAGGEVRFKTKVTKIIIRNSEAVGVECQNGESFHGPVLLATGHSARDVYKFLYDAGIDMESKGIAIGVRLEHPQHIIDCIQYHNNTGRGSWLPPAEYSFVTQCRGRGVYSFCMCPGGFIVPAASGPEQSVVNGMSPSNRGTRWANSGMVVEIRPGDFPEYSRFGVFEIMKLQEDLERKFYFAADKTLLAPAQRMKDFVAGRLSSDLPDSSYPPEITSREVHTILPAFISHRLQDGFRIFGQKAKGFLTNDATVIGLESRTSSPIRIPRDRTSLEHVAIKSLYPVGEGAGYAGGIVSAAIDGMRCAESCYHRLTQL